MSTATWDMPIRMIQYQLSIIESHRRQYPKNRKLPVIVPILVYNGKQSPYPDNLDIIKLFNDAKLAKKTFARPAHLIDLTVISDESIKKHNIIGLLEFTLKHVRDQKLLKTSMKTLIDILEQLVRDANITASTEVGGWAKDYIMAALHYLYYFANIDNKEFTKELEKVDFIKKDNVMGALARKIEQQGIEQGIEKNRRETILAMLAESCDINFIIKITNATIEEINKIKKEN